MRSDLELIKKSFPRSWDTLRVYAIGDTHVGAQNFDETSIKKKISIIKDDPQGVVVLCGDLGDFGLKNSKTNVYQQTLSPREQLDYIHDLFLPIKDKICGFVPGNHEERLTREVGLCPGYDLCVKWGIQDVYRENVAITKYTFGAYKKDQQIVFIGVTTHGSSQSRHKKFMGGFDSVDFGVSGHNHTPNYSPQGRIRVDRVSGSARHVPYKEIVVDANLSPGSYGLKKEYEIPPPPELQYLELKTVREANSSRTLHRVMNYHSISL